MRDKSVIPCPGVFLSPIYKGKRQSVTEQKSSWTCNPDDMVDALNERLTFANEKNETAKQEFQSLKAEMDRREDQYSIRRGDFERHVPSALPQSNSE
jgi:hypothetical protein